MCYERFGENKGSDLLWKNFLKKEKNFDNFAIMRLLFKVDLKPVL